MRIYRTAQQASPQAPPQSAPAHGPQQPSQAPQGASNGQPGQPDPNAIDENLKMQAQQQLQVFQYALAEINKSLDMLEKSGIAQLYSRSSLVNAISSGVLPSLNNNQVAQSFQATQNISQSALKLRNVVKFFKENPTAAQFLGQDPDFMTKIMTDVINSKAFGQYEGVLQQYLAQLDSSTGTQSIDPSWG